MRRAVGVLALVLVAASSGAALPAETTVFAEAKVLCPVIVKDADRRPSVPGIKPSEATGGVQGSFGQACSADFSKRLGLPAAWFKGGPTAGLAREASNRGRDVLGKDRAGVVSGGYGAETVSNAPAGPSMGSESGGKNDEEWQRLLQAVMQQRFGRG